MTEPTAEQAPPVAGTFCWNELMTPDTKAAESFYTKLFGWTTEVMDMGGGRIYTIWKQGNTSAGGMMAIQGPEMGGVPPNWLAYITVDSVDASTDQARSLGANIEVPPTEIPNIGRFSVITDPTGATFGLFQSAH
ncbi:MAG: VOC family protein [Planctomycetota bacterium]|jgi:predicted enzyme related to lactoylglutathione lyase